MSTSESTETRVLVAVVMGGLAFALLSLILLQADTPAGPGRFLLILASAGVFAALVTRAASTVRAAWGVGCSANGLLSIGVAVGPRFQDEVSSGRSTYMEDIDRAIGPLAHFVWALAARLGLIALILAAVLFALSYWFLGPPHRKA